MEERGHLFEKKELPTVKPAQGATLSLLTEQLDSSASQGENPFLEYAKFDGKVSTGYIRNSMVILRQVWKLL